MRVTRINCFETNSSSAHSLVITTREDYEKWKQDTDLYISTQTGEVFTEEQRNQLEEEFQYSCYQRKHVDVGSSIDRDGILWGSIKEHGDIVAFNICYEA